MAIIYLINKLDSHLQLKQGALSMIPRGFTRIQESELEHDDVLWALNRDWVETSKEKPEYSGYVNDITKLLSEPNKGISREEMRAELARLDVRATTPGPVETPAIEPAAQAEAKGDKEDVKTEDVKTEVKEEAKPAARRGRAAAAKDE